MSFLGHDPRFWAAVGVATLLKLVTSKLHSPWRVVVMIGFALFSAVFFTDPVLHFMQWDPDVYKAPTAALLALTGEGIMRSLVTLNWDRMIEFVRAWRGGGK